MAVSGQLHDSAILLALKELGYSLDRRLGGPQSRFGRRGEEKDLALAGTRALTVQPVAVQPEGT
jgi:hypothetical protein